MRLIRPGAPDVQKAVMNTMVPKAMFGIVGVTPSCSSGETGKKSG